MTCSLDWGCSVDVVEEHAVEEHAVETNIPCNDLSNSFGTISILYDLSACWFSDLIQAFGHLQYQISLVIGGTLFTAAGMSEVCK